MIEARELVRRRPVRLAVELVVAGGLGGGLGALVGLVAGLLEGALAAPLIVIGMVTGVVAGLLATLVGREILPRLQVFAFPLRATVAVLALAGGAFATTALGFWVYPRFTLHQVRLVLLVGSLNGLLAVVAGSLVFLYEDLAARLHRAREQLTAERLAQAEARERAARAELRALQARIHPHFFFNALNTVAALVGEDPAAAERLLQRFAGLFRYAFRRGRERDVPLGEELDFIAAYLEIEQARFGEKLRWEVRADDSLADRRVPPLVLQPLVENAVAHGRDPETGEGWILVRATLEEDGLVLRVVDRGPGPGCAGREPPRGHALENVAARVAAAGGGTLTVGPGPGGVGTEARIVFPGAGKREEKR